MKPKAGGGNGFMLGEFAFKRAKWPWRGCSCYRMPYSALWTGHQLAMVLFTLLQDSPAFDLPIFCFNIVWLASRIRTAAIFSRRVHSYPHCHGDIRSRHKTIMIQASNFSNSISRVIQVVLTKRDFILAWTISKLVKYYSVHFLPFELVHAMGRGLRD